MSKKFYRMSVESQLVKKLIKSSWWESIREILTSDKDINIQVRGKYLNVYYKMNNLLNISLDNKNDIKCSLHYKFIPIIKKKSKSSYVTMILRDNRLNIPRPSDQYQYDIIQEDIFRKDNLDILKEQIDNYVSEEKDYQSRLIYKNKSSIIDAEVAFNDDFDNEILSKREQSENMRTRIDLLNFDRNRKQIIAIELKVIFDKRLYSGEIQEQLAKYTTFLGRKKRDIQEAYENVKQVKVALGLMSNKSELVEVNFYNAEIAEKPILVVVCYNQNLIDIFKENIKKTVEGYALGVFFFGATGDLNVPVKKDTNKVIF